MDDLIWMRGGLMWMIRINEGVVEVVVMVID